METIEKYQKILAEYIRELASAWPRNSGEDIYAVCDEAARHYLLVCYGWSERGHFHSTPIHLELKGDKVWIQENLTDQEIDYDLIAAGIPKDHIVLGVIPPEYRKYSDFAAA